MPRASRTRYTALAESAVIVTLIRHVEALEDMATPSFNATEHSETCHNGQKNDDGRCSCQFPYSLIQLPEGRGCGIKDCGAGNFSFDQRSCVCEDGWRAAGITNPFNMAMGRCTQYKCKSNALCADLLDLPFATCPVTGWNCDCGLWASPRSDQGAQCMKPWWALASKATRGISFLSQHLWIIVALASVALLPFGKNTMGTASSYSWTVLQDDLAWSLFALKLGLWLYAFSVTTYLCLALMWLSIYIVLIAAALACMCVLASVAAVCAIGGEASAPVSCEGISSFATAEGCSCVECGSCFEVCCSCGGNAAIVDTPASLYLYDSCFWYCHWSHGAPYQGDCQCNCCGNCGCLPRCRRCRSVFFGLPCYRFLTVVFPRVPENMLGGVSGWIVGTHPLKNRYDPESRIVQILASPCWSLANRSESWRRHVYQWLHERDATEVTAQAGVSVAEARRADELGTPSVILYGDVSVDQQQGVFAEAERIFNYEDYKANQCWICQEPADTWDMWFACRHVFCNRCSGEMLRRRMPCPLCRVRSSRVIRRRALVAQSEMEVEEGDPLVQDRTQIRNRGRASGTQSSVQGGPCPQQIPPSQGAMVDLEDP